MNITAILLAAAIVGGAGLFIGIFLGVSGKKFAYAVAMIIAAALSFWYYYVKTKKELGGITGDTAGYFVCICECAMAVALGGVSFII